MRRLRPSSSSPSSRSWPTPPWRRPRRPPRAHLAATGGNDGWTGTIPPGANPTSDCALTSPLGDSHDTTITVPSGYYDDHDVTVTWKITWDASSANDEILSVFYEDGTEVGSSDGSSNSETVSTKNPKAGTYTAVACGFAAPAPQAYTGSATATTAAKAAENSLPAADSKGLAFSAAVPSDPQRDEAEPLISIDNDGRIYTCGPTGFSNASDYAQVSTDGGDQFHLLGDAPARPAGRRRRRRLRPGERARAQRATASCSTPTRASGRSPASRPTPRPTAGARSSTCRWRATRTPRRAAAPIASG